MPDCTRLSSPAAAAYVDGYIKLTGLIDASQRSEDCLSLLFGRAVVFEISFVDSKAASTRTDAHTSCARFATTGGKVFFGIVLSTHEVKIS